MFRRVIQLLACVLVVGAGQARGSIFSDNFNTENGGNYQLSYSGFLNWNVTAGTVDLIGAGSPWNWFPANGLYVDMDGSTNHAGTMLSKTAFSLNAGTYRLSYDLAGSQRNGYSASDSVVASVNTSVSSQSYTLSPSDPFATYHQDFTLTATQNVTIQFLATGLQGAGDNVGLLLDNVTLEQLTTPDSAIPEPATLAIWSVLGLSAAGTWMVRRQKVGGRGPWSDESRTAIHEIVGRGRG